MKSWKLSVPGSGLGGDVLNWIPSAKAVSSRANELEDIDNQIRAVEAEASFLELKAGKLNRLLMAQQQRDKIKTKAEELQGLLFAGKDGENKKKCFSCGQLGHFQAECSQGGGVLKCWTCHKPGHFARSCTAAPKEEAADEVSEATMSVHGDANHQEGSDDDSTQVGEVLPAVEKTRDVEQHGGATKGMTFAEVLKRDERRGSSPLLTRPAAGHGRTPPAAPTTRPATELAGRSRPQERRPGRTGAGAGALAARRVPPVARHGAGREGEEPGGAQISTWQGETVDKRLKVLDEPKLVEGATLQLRPVINHEGTVVFWVSRGTDKARRVLDQLATGAHWGMLDLGIFDPNKICDHCGRPGGRHPRGCPVVRPGVVVRKSVQVT